MVITFQMANKSNCKPLISIPIVKWSIFNRSFDTYCAGQFARMLSATAEAVSVHWIVLEIERRQYPKLDLFDV